MILKNLDIVHFKKSGLRKLAYGLNAMRSGVYLELNDIGFVVTVINGKVGLIPFLEFANQNSYISSRPNWIKNQDTEVISRIGMKYNSEAFVLEVLGAKNIKQNVLKYCIANEWVLNAG